MGTPTSHAELRRLLDFVSREPIRDRDLCGSDWTGVGTVTQKEFERVDLRGAKLDGVTFTQCEFRDVGFVETHLRGCRFIQCELERVRFERTELHKVEFSQCTWVAPVFDGARMVGAALGGDFKAPTFRGVLYGEGTTLRGSRGLETALGDPIPPHIRYGSFSDLSWDEKWVFADAWAGRLAERLGGELVSDQANRSVRVRGVVEGRKYVVDVDLSWGKARCRAVLANRALVVTVFGGPLPRPTTSADDDLHGPDPDASIGVGLRDGAYLLGRPSNVALEKAFLDSHPGVRDSLAQLVADAQVYMANAGTDSWDLQLNGDLVSPDLDERIAVAIEQLPRWSVPFEQGATPLATPRTPGTPVVHPSLVTCVYCATRTWLGVDRRCRFCGAPN